MKTSFCNDSNFFTKVNELLELPGIALAFLGSKDSITIFIEPISCFLLPRAENFSKQQKIDSLNSLNNWLEKYRMGLEDNSICGFLSYEAFHYTEELLSNIEDKFLFPAGFFCSYKRIINITDKGYKISQNNLDQESLWDSKLSDEQIQIIIEYAKLLLDANRYTEMYSNLECIKDINPARYCSDTKIFTQGVEQIKSKILHGDVYQANLSLLFEAETKKINSQLFLDSINNEKANYAALLNCGLFKSDTYIISNSPETFIQKSQDFLLAAPIKGTIPSNSDPLLNKKAALTLKSSPKDRAELAMIVDLFRNDFGKVATVGSVRVGEFPEIMNLVHLHHLFAEISAKVAKDYSDVDIIFACFPSGSISGAPKYTALSTISQLEKTTRAIYCGGIFAFSRDGFSSSVAIRTAIKIKDKIFFRAGSGITIDSESESELKESLTKAIGFLSAI